jgi:cytochrome c-type biogenesis protein CcmH
VTAFVVLGCAMTVAALLCLVIPLRRASGSRDAVIGTRQANVSVLRDHLAELESDLASGAITREHFASARAELERRVLEEAVGEDQPAGSVKVTGRWDAVALMVVIPAAAIGLYVLIGQPEALRPDVTADAQQVTPSDVEAMVGRLAERLEKNPDDPRGWMMLARSYYVLQRMPEAAAAYAKAAEKVTDDADLLADYADALAMSEGKRIDGKPLELVKRALAIDPSHPKALAMAGTEAFYRKDYPTALGYWEKLLPLLPPESEMAKSVVGGIAEAREFGGAGSARKNATTPANPIKKEVPSASLASVSGKVSVGAAIANQANAADTVFIVARALNGPRIPLAVLRMRVADLPAEFTLDDSLAMSPELKLSGFPQVILTARISKSGNAISQPGDLQGVSPPVKVGTRGIVLTIDAVLP